MTYPSTDLRASIEALHDDSTAWGWWAISAAGLAVLVIAGWLL